MVNSKLKRKKRESLPVVYWHSVRQAAELWRQLNDLRSAHGRDITVHLVVRAHGAFVKGAETSDDSDTPPRPITSAAELSHLPPVSGDVDDEVRVLRSYTG